MSRVILRVVDLETTGLAPPEEIIEVGISDVYWDTDERVASVTAPKAFLFRNSRPITPENRAVHHIQDAELQNAPSCTEDHLRAALMVDGGEPFALVAAHASFEQQWITEAITGPIRWICTVKAAARLYPDAESHSNQATRYRIGLDLPEAWSMPPHRAGPDAYVTGNILADMLKGTTVNTLCQWTREPKFLPRCPIGKWKGKAWADVERSYLDWLLKTADMDADAQHAARLELERRRGAG